MISSNFEINLVNHADSTDFFPVIFTEKVQPTLTSKVGGGITSNVLGARVNLGGGKGKGKGKGFSVGSGFHLARPILKVLNGGGRPSGVGHDEVKGVSFELIKVSSKLSVAKHKAVKLINKDSLLDSHRKENIGFIFGRSLDSKAAKISKAADKRTIEPDEWCALIHQIGVRMDLFFLQLNLVKLWLA